MVNNALFHCFELPLFNAAQGIAYYLREPPGRSHFYTTSARLPDVQNFYTTSASLPGDAKLASLSNHAEPPGNQFHRQKS